MSKRFMLKQVLMTRVWTQLSCGREEDMGQTVKLRYRADANTSPLSAISTAFTPWFGVSTSNQVTKFCTNPDSRSFLTSMESTNKRFWNALRSERLLFPCPLTSRSQRRPNSQATSHATIYRRLIKYASKRGQTSRPLTEVEAPQVNATGLPSIVCLAHHSTGE